MRLKDVLSHRYFKSSFNSGLKVFALDVSHDWEAFKYGDPKVTPITIENEMYEAVKYLLEKYANRDITFIIQNWEGDWMMRAAFDEWIATGVPDNWQDKADLLLKWILARQKGVDKARKELGKRRCKIFHAVEVNKVFDGKKGIPSVASYILPKVKVDMVSWSAYDGIKYGKEDGSLMYEGLKYLKKQLVPSDYMKGKKVVYIGEIALKENDQLWNSMEKVKQSWDAWLSAYIAHDVPYIFQWALYDNELLYHDPSFNLKKLYKNKDMKGMWLIRPDGTRVIRKSILICFSRSLRQDINF